MSESLTPFDGINEVLSALQQDIESVLGDNLLGIYVVGSLAVGDFSPSRSDIDLIVVTHGDIEPAQVQRLQVMHAQVAKGSSRWSQKLEIVYAPRAALHVVYRPRPEPVSQLEKGTALFSAPLEAGWVFQCWTLRECGLVVCGPPPDQLGIRTEPRAIAEAVRAVAAQWLDDIENDPTWLGWLREPGHHPFVIQTLCRLLYSQKTGEVASKPRALEWGERALAERWGALVAKTARGQCEPVDDETLETTLAFIRYTYEAGQHGLDG